MSETANEERAEPRAGAAPDELPPAIRALRELFLARLLEASPRSVLDVACGQGDLVAWLAERRIPAVGLEHGEQRALRVARRGLTVLRADAERLPFETGAFDWAVMRHAAHHLPHPAAGIRELARVARSGVVVAEPWRELSVPAQELAADWDAWARELERRRGDVHHDDLTLDTLVRLLPESDTWLHEFITFQPHGFRALEDVEAQAEELSPYASRYELERRDVLLDSAREIGIGITGSAILVARREQRARPGAGVPKQPDAR